MFYSQVITGAVPPPSGFDLKQMIAPLRDLMQSEQSKDMLDQFIKAIDEELPKKP
jgi:hypothetical protein